MATGLLNNVIHHLRRGAFLKAADDCSDAELLETFIAERDDRAFEALVRRHGPMVLGVCRRILRSAHDIEDAFQATFLVLVRKAAGIRPRGMVGNWLHGVAYHIALKGRAAVLKRRLKEGEATAMRKPTSHTEIWQQVQSILDEELERLPTKYRAAIVLCELEGKTRKAVARQLKWAEGTVASRLARARVMLAKRLKRRGVELSGGVLATVLAQNAATASLPASLVISTTKAGGMLAAGTAAPGAISAKVAALTEGMIRAMFLTKLKLAVIGMLIVASFGAALAGLGGNAGATAPIGTPAPALQQGQDAPAPAPRALLKEASEIARNIEDNQWKAWTLQSIAEAQAKAGDKAEAGKTFAEAIKTAKEIKGPNLADPGSQARHTLCWIAVAQAETGDVKAALKTLEEIEEGSREYAVAQVACVRARSGDVQGALEMAENVTGNPKDWVLAAVVAAQARAGKTKEAAKTADKLGSDHDRVFALITIARAHAKAKDRKSAEAGLQAALKVAEGIEEVEDGSGRATTVGNIVELQAEMGQVAEARELAKTVSKEPWRGIVLSRLVKAQAGAGDVRGAKETAKSIAPEYQKGEALKEILTAQLKAGDVKSAQSTAAAIESVFWRVASLAEIAKAQVKAGDRKAAAETFKSAFATAGQDGGEVRDDEPGVGGLRYAAFCLILKAQAEAGHERDAIAWAARQSTPLLRSQAMVNIARGLAMRHEKGN